jgi:hypothetical protein
MLTDTLLAVIVTGLLLRWRCSWLVRVKAAEARARDAAAERAAAEIELAKLRRELNGIKFAGGWWRRERVMVS